VEFLACASHGYNGIFPIIPAPRLRGASRERVSTTQKTAIKKPTKLLTFISRFSCPPCYTATRTLPSPSCPTADYPACTGPASPRIPCTITVETSSTTLVDNIFCSTETVTPTCPTEPVACNELLDTAKPWDRLYCHTRTITYRDPVGYDFCAPPTTCNTDGPLETKTYERCKKWRCPVPTRDCGVDDVEPVRTKVTATVTETVGCSVAVYTGDEPCSVCPTCLAKPTEEPVRRRYQVA